MNIEGLENFKRLLPNIRNFIASFDMMMEYTEQFEDNGKLYSILQNSSLGKLYGALKQVKEMIEKK